MTGFKSRTLNTVLMLAMILLVGCSTSSQSTITETDLLTQQLANYSKQPQKYASKIRQLAERASAIQHWPIVAQSYLLLCQYESRDFLKDSACDKLTIVSYLITNNELRFDIYIALYLHTPNTKTLHAAQLIAQSNHQKMRLALVQNKIPEQVYGNAEALSINERGQYYYLIGKANSNIEQLEQALQYFSTTGQLQKAADTYFLIAKLALEQGDQHKANYSAAHSYFLLAQLNNIKAQKAVEKWIDDHSTTL